MQEIVFKILENSKQSLTVLSPRQLFYRQFDAGLRLAQQNKAQEDLAQVVEKLELYGEAAQIPAAEIAHRKTTLFWTLANA